MTSAYDKWVELIKGEMRKVFSETTVDHAMNPRNLGKIEDADGFARVTGPCGDTMEIWLKIGNGMITEASFLTNGCGTTLAAGSMVTELVKGKRIPAALKLNQQAVLHALGGLPEDSAHCALLAVNTLKAAIKDYFTSRNEPWKRAYDRR